MQHEGVLVTAGSASDEVSPMSARPDGGPSAAWVIRIVLLVAATLLALVGVLYLIYELNGIIRWVLIAVFLATALNPAVSWGQQLQLSRLISTIIVFVAVLLFIALIVALVLPPVSDQVEQMISHISKVANQRGGINAEITRIARRFHVEGYIDTIRAQIKVLPGRAGAAVGPLLDVTRSVARSVTATISVLLITFLLLLDGPRIVDRGLDLVPREQRDHWEDVLHRCAGAIHGYVSGNLIISLIAGVAAYIAMRILGIPFAASLAVIVAVFDLVPLVGATLAAVIVVIVGFLVSPVKGVILIAYFVVYQQVENHFIQLQVYGRSVHLPPLAVFLAVLAGTELLGILGALIAIPVVEILRILGLEILDHFRPHDGEPAPTAEVAVTNLSTDSEL